MALPFETPAVREGAGDRTLGVVHGQKAHTGDYPAEKTGPDRDEKLDHERVGAYRMWPTKSYFICTMPRTGSELLCDLLAGTGVAGRPTEVFPQAHLMSRHLWWGIHRTLGANVVDHTTGNGVFGTKVFWTHMHTLAWWVWQTGRGLPGRLAAVALGGTLGRGMALADERYRHSEPMSVARRIVECFPNPDECDPEMPGAHLPGTPTAVHGALSSFFPKLRYVYLRREDTVKQAISFSRAEQTGVWHIRGGHPGRDYPAPTFDREAISRAVRYINRAQESWRTYFDGCHVRPLEITYESLVEDIEEVVQEILHFVDERAIEALLPTSDLRKQSDAVTDEWAARYRSECGIQRESI